MPDRKQNKKKIFNPNIKSLKLNESDEDKSVHLSDAQEVDDNKFNVKPQNET